MSETITATEANRDFSRILREVGNGQTYIITSYGRPIARLVPTDEDESDVVAGVPSSPQAATDSVRARMSIRVCMAAASHEVTRIASERGACVRANAAH